MIIYFGMQSGFSIGFANPNVLGVAQMIAEVPVFPELVPCCLLYTKYYFYVFSNVELL